MKRLFPKHWIALAMLAAIVLTGCPSPTTPGSSGGGGGTVNQPPVISVTFPSLTDPSADVYFDAGASIDSDGDISNAVFDWEFGDGDSAMNGGPIQNHTYTTKGSYTFTLTLTDEDGAKASKSYDILVNHTPVADINASATSIDDDDSVTLNASGSTDADGDNTILAYLWDFGDGNTDSSSDTSHSYDNGGTYTVTLTVTDDMGTQGSTTLEITVTDPDNTPPTASFTGPSGRVNIGETINFNSSASTGGGDDSIASYSWDFGDGASSTADSPSHSYSSSGDKTVVLTVTDEAGSSDSANLVVEVNVPPAIDSTTLPSSGTAGDTVSFSASASDSDGNISSYIWDFGDGTNTSGAAVNHIYNNGGNYTVELIVTDNDGATASSSGSITVNGPPLAAFTMTPADGKIHSGESVSFDASGSSDEGSITTFAWDFDGDGTVDETNGTATTSHTYTSAGSFEVELTVTDNDGATTSTSASVDVNAFPVIVSLAGTPDPVNAGLNASFSSDVSDSDGTVTSYLWDFGDGSSSSEAAPSHSFSTGGEKTVSLTVTDNDGASTTDSFTFTVNTLPVASFSIVDSRVNIGESASFDPSGSSDVEDDLAGQSLTYSWDYGDGSSDSTGSHSYSESGNFNVTLTVTDSNGAQGSSTSTIAVNAPPVADAGPDQSLNYSVNGNIIVLDGSNSSDDIGGESYSWSFISLPAGSTLNNASITGGNTASASFDISGEGDAECSLSGELVYTLQLTVTDADGISETDDVMISITGQGAVTVGVY